MEEMKCPRCGKENDPDALNCRECGLQLQEAPQAVHEAAERNAETGEILTQKPKKSHKVMVIGIIAAVVVAAAAVVAIVLLRGNKTLGVTPEEIEGWFRDAAEEGNSDAEFLIEIWELLEDAPEVKYTSTSDKKIERFNFDSMGLSIVGYCDAKDHEISQMIVSGDLYGLYSILDEGNSYSTICSITEVTESALFELVAQEALGLSEEKAEEVIDESGDGKEVVKNGTTWCVKGYHNDEDLVLMISTFEEMDTLMDYMKELEGEIE